MLQYVYFSAAHEVFFYKISNTIFKKWPQMQNMYRVASNTNKDILIEIQITTNVSPPKVQSENHTAQKCVNWV